MIFSYLRIVISSRGLSLYLPFAIRPSYQTYDEEVRTYGDEDNDGDNLKSDDAIMHGGKVWPDHNPKVVKQVPNLRPGLSVSGTFLKPAQWSSMWDGWYVIQKCQGRGTYTWGH